MSIYRVYLSIFSRHIIKKSLFLLQFDNRSAFFSTIFRQLITILRKNFTVIIYQIRTTKFSFALKNCKKIMNFPTTGEFALFFQLSPNKHSVDCVFY